MDLGIKGLRTLVTAGASGIGLHTALTFAKEGAQVHVCDIDDDAMAKLTAAHPEIGVSRANVADRQDVSALFEQAVDSLGGLDCLINNAGVAGPTGPVHEIDPDEWDRCISVSLTGQFNCTRLAVAPLKDSRNPSIINLSSAAGKFAFRNRTPYASAKWGVIGFTKTIALELGQYGIRCNAILPGIVQGERNRQVVEALAKSHNTTVEEVENERMSFASIKEMIDPDQLADMMAFLASPRGRTISGQAISIDSDLRALI